MRSLGIIRPIIKLAPGFIYLMVTTLMAGTPGLALMHYKFIDISFFYALTAVIAVALFAVEWSMPKSFKAIQVALALSSYTIYANLPEIRTAAYVLLGIIGLMKVYAIAIRFKKPDATSLAQNGDAFSRSNEWRKLKLQFWAKVGPGVKCYVPDCPDTAKHVDHIKPRSKFPHLALDINNLQPLCAKCNQLKSNTIIVDFRPIAKGA